MIDQDTLKSLLDYDPQTGVFTWKTRAASLFTSSAAQKRWNTRYAGKRAGSSHQGKSGYAWRYLSVFKSRIYEHHAAWLYMTGKPLPAQIDHVNRDATDNRWENIRPATHADNCHNVSRRLDNKSGISGVDWNRGKWRARGTVNGNRKNLGYFTEIDEAAMAMLEFRADHGFSPAHGLEVAHYHAVTA